MRRLACGGGTVLLFSFLLACSSAPASPDVAAEAVGDGSGDAAAETLPRQDAADADAVPGEPVTLLSGGKSAHVIVLQAGASPSETHAAEVLQDYFEQSTGAKLPIVTEPPADAPMIVLGRGPIAAGLGASPSDEELGTQGFLFRTVPPHVVIAGTAGVGTLHGVNRFLEEQVGVRWLAPGVTKVPKLTDLTIPSTDKVVRPAFAWRHTSYEWPGKDDEFLSRMGDNDGDKEEDSPYGFEIAHDGRAHSYFTYVSPDEFFDEHPEYFSEIGGIRVRDETQLCLTNPDVLDIVTARMLQRMAEKPHELQHNFSQMDRYNYCQCPKCKAMNEQYGTAGGTQFWFVNELAKRTSEVYPDKQIGTLAYTYTEEPPVGMEMHPNVAVWLCHMYPSCDSHPIATCPLNADYKRRAETWAGLTWHLYVWHYITNFTHYYVPFPNFTAMAQDLRFYRDIGVEGIYLQGMGHDGGGGEFSLLRPYYGMHLLFNPDLDPVALRDGFLQAYYGKAWEPIRDYVELLHKEVASKDIHMHLYTNPAQGYLPDPVVDAGEALFDKAQAAVADDPEMLDRVQVAHMPLTYARLFPRNGYEILGETLHWLGKLAGMDEVLGFIDQMNAHGFKMVREVSGEPDTLLLLYSMFSMDAKVYPIQNQQLRIEVVENLAGRALRVIDLATGEGVTASNVKPALYFPFCGGIEDRVGAEFPGYGWVEPAVVTDHTAHAVTIRLNTLNGFQLTRQVTLDPLNPVAHVEVTVKNPGSDPVQTRYHSHLELDLGDLAATTYSFQSLAGAAVDDDLTAVLAGLREGVHFYDQDVPDGAWSFAGTKGLKVTQSFDSSKVEYAWLYAYPESLNELELELWSPLFTLEAGASWVFTYDLDVVPVP